jgi:DNA-binding HxlR family transcriptional regulator
MSVTEAGATAGSRDLRRLPRGDRELVEQIEHSLEVLHGKWKVHLLFLMARGVHRHCKLLECLPGASKKMMTDTLRALERDGIVNRCIYAEVPLRVEYSLTPVGWSMTEPLLALAEWDKSHSDEMQTARSNYLLRDDRVGGARRTTGETAAARRETAAA